MTSGTNYHSQGDVILSTSPVVKMILELLKHLNHYFGERHFYFETGGVSDFPITLVLPLGYFGAQLWYVGT